MTELATDAATTDADFDPAAAFAQRMAAHRSIRRYKPDPLPDHFIDGVLQQALHGSSSSGNLNLVSVVKTRDAERKRRLYELHSEQPMVLQAPLVLTFCADTHRTRAWLADRGARPGFGDFKSYHVAAFDAVILAQTAALAFESHGLGICYMGTTLFSMAEIAEFLALPDHVVPVTSLVVGHPDEAPAQRDRLPPTAWIHSERYAAPTPDSIERDFSARDRAGWERYLSMRPEMAQQFAEHGITSLAQYYTSKLKYDPDRFAEYSEALRRTLTERGFLP
jgi:nitroreductase